MKSLQGKWTPLVVSGKASNEKQSGNKITFVHDEAKENADLQLKAGRMFERYGKLTVKTESGKELFKVEGKLTQSYTRKEKTVPARRKIDFVPTTRLGKKLFGAV